MSRSPAVIHVTDMIVMMMQEFGTVDTVMASTRGNRRVMCS